MTKRSTRKPAERRRPASQEEIARAVEALGLNVPVRAAWRKGKIVELFTRAGRVIWEVPSAEG